MKTRYIKYLLILVTLGLWSCEPNVDEFVPSAGSADFSVFVSVGDSYSAGYIDGALSDYGQITGFTNIMATQFKSVGAGDFNQPMLPPGTSVGSSLNGSYELQVVDGRLMPVPTEGNPEVFAPENWINGDGPFNNVGVPGAKSFHLLSPLFGDYTQGVGNYNPYYTRFASEPGVSTVISDAMLNNPTFFSLWIGGNDVLWYALAGGTGSESGMGSYDITPQNIFDFSVSQLVAALTSTGAKGVLCNIPGIDALPYFSYIKWDDLELTAEYVALLNDGYNAEYNPAAEAMGLPKIEFTEGRNAFVIADPTYPLQIRQMKEGEKVLLSALSGILGDEHWGSMTPLPDNESLNLTEIGNIANAIDGYNAIIKSAADANDLAFVDANKVMNDLITGVMIDGTVYNTEFVTGGMFSLDGIHASGRGYAIIANEFIKAINAKYGATVPLANVNDFIAVEFP